MHKISIKFDVYVYQKNLPGTKFLLEIFTRTAVSSILAQKRCNINKEKFDLIEFLTNN